MVTSPLMANDVPSQDNLVFALPVPPNLKVPSFKLNSEPCVADKLVEVIFPVEIKSPVIDVN